MAGHTTMRRDGGWSVELLNPLGEVDKLDIRPPTLRHTVRWGNNEIPSVLALLSELTGVSESVLQDLSGADSDRVLMALSYIVPAGMKQDFSNGTKPLATPVEALTPEQQYEVIASDNDEVDPRFPKAKGEVKRFKQPPQPTPPQEGDDNAGGVDLAPPDVARRVG